MDTKEFKYLFNNISKNNGFESAFGGWFKESSECIAVLELQKSNFGKKYYLNIKIFIQGAFNRTYERSKELVQNPMGHITNQIRDEDVLNLGSTMSVETRKENLENLFNKIIVPYTETALTKLGIREMVKKGNIFLPPAVKDELA